jgi:Cu/Ag efflux protein CusF
LHFDRQSIRLTIGILAIISFAACYGGNNPTSSQPTGPAAATATTAYQAVGTVKGVKMEPPSIDIDHEDIPGLMPAMQMEFHVSSKALLEGLNNGDKIDFSVENGVGGLKVVAIKKK